MNPAVQYRVDGELVTVRPIQPGDLELEKEFIRRLSPAAKRFRFLGGVRELPPDELRRFCDVDGEKAMAFVATVREDGREREIGVSRYAPGDGADTREMAVTVADEWQHRGLGSTLAGHLIGTAKRHGVRRLFSVDLADNILMAALAKELKMTAMPDPDDPRQVIYSLDLSQAAFE